MAVFGAAEFSDHERVLFYRDARAGLRAIIAIHNTIHGPAFGGCRMRNYSNEAEALADVLRLSRGMAYKAAINRLPIGGAKSVILGDPGRDKSEPLLRAMAEAVHTLKGDYITGEDSGIGLADVDLMQRSTPYVLGGGGGGGDPSPVTAYGVFVGIKAAVRHKFGTDSLRGIRVAVQGMGAVGAQLCALLARAGAVLTVADIASGRCEGVARELELDCRIVDPAHIHAQNVDIFAPCAFGAVLNDQTIPELSAPIVAGAANNQLERSSHGEELHRRGILYAPDYLINSAGLMNIVAESRERFAGDKGALQRVMGQVETIYDRLIDVFGLAQSTGKPPERVCDRMAEQWMYGESAA